ncbi:MAG: MerR family transcriptional regulator [Ilumatobacteraceae bacterium]
MNLCGGWVSSYTIGDVAERSGFSASALRYFEEIGLQRRFHELVTAKVRATDAQIDGLRTFAEQLRQAAGLLAGDRADGPFNDGCACATAEQECRSPSRSP